MDIKKSAQFHESSGKHEEGQKRGAKMKVPIVSFLGATKIPTCTLEDSQGAFPAMYLQ